MTNSSIGIDLGSYMAKLGVASATGMVQVIGNDIQDRQTPVAVAYKQGQERKIGEAVRSQHRRNLKGTVLFITRYLGLDSSSE